MDFIEGVAETLVPFPDFTAMEINLRSSFAQGCPRSEGTWQVVRFGHGVGDAIEMKSVRYVSEMHEFSKRCCCAIQFDVGGPSHSDIHGWHIVCQ